MTKSKITTATLTALALAGTLVATSGSAQAHSHWGAGVGIGIAAGALIGAAAATKLSRPGVRDTRLSRLPSGRALRPLGQRARHPGLRLLISPAGIGACPVHPRADLDDPPGHVPVRAGLLFSI